jgi:acyl-homoserine lactone acylase PvdQ
MQRSLMVSLGLTLGLTALPLAGRQEDAASLRTRAQAALAPIAGELALAGLQKPVEVIRDTWGVPHIYAQTTEDLFFAQGFVAAQDRLWQLDLWRRTAEGRLSQILGPSAVDRDTFARLLRYRGDPEVEWRSYAPDAKRIAEAFVRGVNAQIAYVTTHPEKLPIEFQLTIVGIDQQDLYVERLNPANPDQYLYKGTWEPMRVERESIAVHGETPRQVELRFTRHGPVIHVDRARHRAYALRWVGMEPGTAGYLASLSLNVAKNWPEFLRALEGWKVPSENLVYADRDGNIGWVAAGLAPVRPNWNGLLPVAGHEGQYEWSGFLRVADLPQSFNPAGGFIATANHNILPPGYAKMLGYEWSAPHRFRRIAEVLSARRAQIEAGGRAQDKLTVAEFERLQHDELSVVARAIALALRRAMQAHPIADARRREAATLLADWDGTLGNTTAAAALYQIWLPRLQRAMAQAVRSPADRQIAGDRLSADELLEVITRGDPAAADVLVGPALDAALAEAEKRMGPDRAAWAWGRIHRARFEHPLATTAARRDAFNLTDVPRGGDGTTPNATGSGDWQTSGASFREVIDLGDWDRSTTINVPGESAQPGSPYYGNLLPLWAEGRYHPMLFSRAAVDKHAAAKLVLKPAAAALDGQAGGQTLPVPRGEVEVIGAAMESHLFHCGPGEGTLRPGFLCVKSRLLVYHAGLIHPLPGVCPNPRGDRGLAGGTRFQGTPDQDTRHQGRIDDEERSLEDWSAAAGGPALRGDGGGPGLSGPHGHLGRGQHGGRAARRDGRDHRAGEQVRDDGRER